jgi:hypothetical protein
MLPGFTASVEERVGALAYVFVLQLLLTLVAHKTVSVGLMCNDFM